MTVKKIILFVIPEYSFGGTNKSLQNLLSFIDHEKYDIHLLCLYEDGKGYYDKEFKKWIKKSWAYQLLHDNVITRKILGLYQRLNKKDKLIEGARLGSEFTLLTIA